MDNFLAGRFRDPLNSPEISTQLLKPIHPMLYLEETLAFMTYHSGTSITEENQVVDFKITGSIPVIIRLKGIVTNVLITL